MGAVYLAHDTQLDRPVALKIPLFSADEDAQVLARFYREARAAATVLHANVCPVYDVGEVDGVPYLTMGYIEGKSLAEWLRAKPPAPRQSALLVRNLALALHEAHKKGVIHRDLKPANVMIDRRGEPVVMDFGLARRARPGDARLTQRGAVMGTPAYMPPEQVSGDPDAMGPACDIYSLGVILYELLSGRPPFEGDAMAVLSQVLLDEPLPPSRLRPDIDAELEAICRKAMAKRIEDRYTSMADFAGALSEYLRGKTSAPERSATESGPTIEVMAARRAANPRPSASPPEEPTESPVADRKLRRPRRGKKGGRGLPPWLWLAAGAAAGGVLVLAWGIYRATHYGHIRIDVRGAMAPVEITVDDESGHHPGESFRLRAGENHFVEATAAEHEPLVHGFTVHRGENAPLVLELTPKFGTTRIALSEPAAPVEVHLDGDPAPLADPGQALRLAIGEHHLQVRGPGYEEVRQTFTIRAGDNPPLSVVLRRKAVNPPPSVLPGPKAVALVAPRLLSPADGTVFSHFPRKTVLRWTPVDGAAAYKVEAEYQDPFMGGRWLPHLGPAQGRTAQCSLEFLFVGEQPGRWRVRAVDGSGRQGPWSDWWTFRYVPAPAAAEGPWHGEYEAARAEAARSGKDLLIDFGGSDWCLPCRSLKTRILSRPDFVGRAAKHFVLVDIDDLHRTPMPPDRKQRYQELQQRYGIEVFPTVVLATPEGLAYARTTYLESINDPVAYWEHLQPLRARGQKFRAALARAGKLEGRARAEALAEALSQVHPEFVLKFYADRVKELQGLTPNDATGYLAFLNGRKAVAALQEKVQQKGLVGTNVGEVDALIAAEKLRGEALQDALVLRALCCLEADRPLDALAALAEMLDAQKTRSAFDRGDFVPLDAKGVKAIRWRIDAGRKDPKDRLAQYYALHRLFEFELPDRFEVCCGSGYRPKFLARGVVGERYGKALLEATAGLSGEARAKALGRGLEGTGFWRQGAIGRIVDQVIPQLVGQQEAAKYLPPPYRGWVAR